MTTLRWTLAVEPAQAPEYWLLLLDGNLYAFPKTPYTGAGDYSLELDTIDPPLPPGAHTVSVAMVGNGTIGPQSPAVSIDVPDEVQVIGIGQQTGQQTVDQVAWPAPASAELA